MEYDRALSRALTMPDCRVVPFFGAFLRDLRDILATTPSLVVLAPAGEHTHLEVNLLHYCVCLCVLFSRSVFFRLTFHRYICEYKNKIKL